MTIGSRQWNIADGYPIKTDVGEFRGKQELYTRQSPQRLKTLPEHALIESAVSSNRLEGVEVDPKRTTNDKPFSTENTSSNHDRH